MDVIIYQDLQEHLLTQLPRHSRTLSRTLMPNLHTKMCDRCVCQKSKCPQGQASALLNGALNFLEKQSAHFPSAQYPEHRTVSATVHTAPVVTTWISQWLFGTGVQMPHGMPTSCMRMPGFKLALLLTLASCRSTTLKAAMKA